MAQIRVTPEQLVSVAGQLNAGAGSIESTLSQLAGNVAPLGDEWAGAASARFQQLWQQWHTSSRQLQQALTEMSGLMQRAAGAFEANDLEVARSFTR